ncbi:MAG: hypothetical protein WBZ37_29690 [Mycobacterium sp.]
MDEDWDQDADQIVDLDVTGDPQLDQFGYQSPRRPGPRPGFTSLPERDWLAQAKRDRQQRERRRDRQQRHREEARRRQEVPPSHPAQRPRPTAQPLPQSAPVEPEPESKVPLPGQHGAYFEVRTVRRWWAPWRKRKVWQQVSTWHVGQPPTGARVVTVADVAQLPGQVHTIGRVSGTGAVEY